MLYSYGGKQFLAITDILKKKEQGYSELNTNSQRVARDNRNISWCLWM